MEALRKVCDGRGIDSSARTLKANPRPIRLEHRNSPGISVPGHQLVFCEGFSPGIRGAHTTTLNSPSPVTSTDDVTRAPGRSASAASGRCACGAYLARSRPEKFRESFSSGFAAHLLADTCQVDSLVPLLNAASIEKFNVSGVSARDRAEIVDILSRFDDLTLTSSREGNLEIMAAGVSKASARVWLAHVRGVRACDVVAFGDWAITLGCCAGREWPTRWETEPRRPRSRRGRSPGRTPTMALRLRSGP